MTPPSSPPPLSLSSPKSKQEVMVRSPPVMSPSSAAQMESKLANQGKQGSAASQSQPSPCDSKTLGGCHAPKGAQGGGGVGSGLKNGQGLNSGSKVKLKRERSTSLESYEQRDSATPNNNDGGEPRGMPATTTAAAILSVLDVTYISHQGI